MSKSLVRDDPSTGVVNGPESLTPASLPYSQVTVKVIELEKVALGDMQRLKTFFEYIDFRGQVFSS